MSSVTKCDICGKILEESKPGSKTFKIDVSERDYITGDYEYSSIDCCPECTKKMDEFISVLKSGNHFVIYQDDARLLK